MLMTLIALDFDGVLCDSARETGITGWKAGGRLWTDMGQPLPPEPLLDAYCRARPVIETGYEAILMMRLLKDGEDAEELLDSFPRRLQEVIRRSGIDASGLKGLYGSVRDRWIRDDPGGWLSLSPLFPGMADVLEGLATEAGCYILTTKQERFVRQLLEHSGVHFAAEHIFGLDRGLRKEAVLRRLLELHPNCRAHFVEDRLPTLRRLLAQPDLAAIRLHLACWGYNTEAERREAARLKIHLLGALSLAEILNTEYDIDQ
jgi:phosphoglycolate phosphatase-like HAD superfamily hydrolase